jgi:hypothetical protein
MLIVIVIVIILLAVSIYTYCLTARILRPIPKGSRSQPPDAPISVSQYPESSPDLAAAAWEAELSRRLIRHDIDAADYQMAMTDLAHQRDVSSEAHATKHRRPGSGT